MLLACSGALESSAPPPPAPTPNIYLAQSTYDFTGIILDNSADRTFEIKNNGIANLKIGQVLSPNLPFSIASDTCSLATLTTSQTCSLKIRFSPTSQGPFTTTLSVPSNDPDSSTVNISLSGVGYGLNVWINQVSTGDCLSFVAEVTVTDPANPANDVWLRALNESNFTLNGGIITPPISNLYPSPVSLVLAIDSSESLIGILPNIKAAANKGFGDMATLRVYSHQHNITLLNDISNFTNKSPL
jgi:hypothetical protein